MSDYIPQNDASFDIWQDNLVTLVGENIATWGISSEDFATVTESQAVWATAYVAASVHQTRTPAEVRAKDDARDDYEPKLRAFVAAWLAYNNKLSNSDRESLGLHVKSGTHTPVAVPTSTPVGIVDFSVRLQHSICYTDSDNGSKAKPKGVKACEVWSKIGGDAPKDASELTFVGDCSKNPFVISYEGSLVGTTVVYWLRWVNTRNKTGPWSSPISGMIAG